MQRNARRIFLRQKNHAEKPPPEIPMPLSQKPPFPEEYLILYYIRSFTLIFIIYMHT